MARHCALHWVFVFVFYAPAADRTGSVWRPHLVDPAAVSSRHPVWIVCSECVVLEQPHSTPRVGLVVHRRVDWPGQFSVASLPQSQTGPVLLTPFNLF